MSDSIKAADAKFGEWYEVAGKRLRSISDNPHPDTETSMKFVSNSGGHVEFVGVDKLITHLPDCTGWDWQPPQPEPDTSLMASIERFSSVEQSQEERGYLDSDLYYEDQQRIIEAARKWDEWEETITLMGAKWKEEANAAKTATEFRKELNDPDESRRDKCKFDMACLVGCGPDRCRHNPVANDPDGVGEGFEKALPDNAEQYSYDGVQWNSMEMCPLTTFNTPPTMFRRRIEPAEAPITRPAKAESIECIRGTTGCPINHDEDNGICVKPVREAKDARDASGTEPLREWVKDCYADELYVVRVSGTTQKFDVDHVREVSPELDQWHAELVRLLELEPDGDDAVGYWHWVCEILNHLAKRPQRGVK